jgi:hypothetical protein
MLDLGECDDAHGGEDATADKIRGCGEAHAETPSGSGDDSAEATGPSVGGLILDGPGTSGASRG